MKKELVIRFIYMFIVAYLLYAGTRALPPPGGIPTASPSPTMPSTPISSASETATVSAVIDGDTILLTDKRKVRYIGIDTPETKHPVKKVQCFGKEASEKNKDLVEGKTIRMKKDVSETDRYGRLLRYVWVGDVFVNEYLAREGYALQATFPPDVAYAETFRQAAEKARSENRGLWNKCK